MKHCDGTERRVAEPPISSRKTNGAFATTRKKQIAHQCGGGTYPAIETTHKYRY